jgi:hypothetical protein
MQGLNQSIHLWFIIIFNFLWDYELIAQNNFFIYIFI